MQEDTKSFIKVIAYSLAVTLAIMFPLFLIVDTIAPDESDPAPYGCTWYDMNPSKPADYQLACVPGYPKEK